MAKIRKIPHLRWGIVSMLFFASVLNYVDRQTLSILAPSIQADLKLDDNAYANIVNLFLVAYTIAYLLSGRVTDWLGPRLSMSIFITWWSVSNMLTAFSHSARSLGVFRFMLGLGEAGNYTAAPKVVSEWFPAKERGVAIGIYTLGATIGATLAPIIVVALAEWHSWQAAFVVTGALGLLWLGPWIWLYRSPREHPRITEHERQVVLGGQEERAAADAAEAAAVTESEASRWASVLGRPDVWLLLLARMLTDPVWYFYQFWLAKYLFTARGLEQGELGISWVVFLAADIGTLAGGFISALFIKRGARPAAGRLWAMALCACLVPLSPLVTQTNSLYVALGVAMVVVLAHMSWLINLSALVVDLIPKRYVATAFGVVAAGSTVGGILMNNVVAKLVTNYSYTHWFVIMAFLHPTAWLILWAARVHRARREEVPAAAAVASRGGTSSGPIGQDE